MDLKKIRREHCSKIEIVLTEKEEGEIKKQPKKRTDCHVRHFPDLPFGDITIEGIRIVKHCTQQQRKVQG